MTTREDNEILTRVGPGTPMGDLMRQYWVPLALSSEFPEPDGDPVRIRLLGESLIGYRTTSGKMGLIQNACPHRGASMFFGRNEEEGIRCVYHGWKFDTEGHCVDMPSEPELTQAKDHVRFTSYPCVERGGLVWTYMGPRETPPPLPDLEATLMPGTVTIASSQDCNWLQAMENNMDTLHAGFLHNGAFVVDASSAADSNKNLDAIGHKTGLFHTVVRDSGASFACERPKLGDEANSTYWRIMNWHFPFYTQSPTQQLDRGSSVVAVVPMDDEHTISFTVGRLRRDGTMGDGSILPNTTDWFGRFRPEVTLDEDLHIDRQAQRYEKNTQRGYTGIATVFDQDRGITESQGVIQDRSTENLRTTDAMVHLVRSRLIEAAKALREHGTTPPGVDDPRAYRQRSGNLTLPNGVDIWEATKELRETFLPETQEGLVKAN